MPHTSPNHHPVDDGSVLLEDIDGHLQDCIVSEHKMPQSEHSILYFTSVFLLIIILNAVFIFFLSNIVTNTWYM